MNDSKVLASMVPGMTGLLRRIAVDPDVTPHHVHGPMLKGLTTRGLVRHSNNRLAVTWAGQQVLNQIGEDQ